MARQKSISEDKSGTFVLRSKDTRLLNYQNAELLLTAARKGRDVTKKDMGIEIIEEYEPSRIQKYSINPK